MDFRPLVFDKIYEAIDCSVTIDKERKTLYISKLRSFKSKSIQSLSTSALRPLTAMDVKYIICFLIDMAVGDIALLFNIEPSSVHMARYRIKKKFAAMDTWSF